MAKRIQNAASILILLTSCLWADRIVLRDGDRITGKVVKKDGEKLTVESKNFGVVTLQWADVASIETETPVNVVLSGDRTVKGNIRTEGGQIVVDSTGPPQSAAPADVVALRSDAEQRTYERLLRPGLLDLWAITGSINIAGTKGNAESSTITTPINFVRASRTSRTTLYFNSIRSSATVNGVNARTANAIRGGWAYNRNLTRRVLLNAFNDYEYDQFQALDLRVVLGGGLGYEVIRTDTARFDLLAGVAWNHEKFGPPAPAVSFTRNSAEAYWGNDFTYKLSTRTALNQRFRMFNNLTNTGEYRINFDIGASTVLMRWLTWNVALSDRYLSNPVAGRKKNDFLYSTGFGFTFAR
jgi:putative salt-induced outer membrane protein YdiY